MRDYLLDLLLDLDAIQQNPHYHPEGDALFHSLQVFQLAHQQSDSPVLWAAALFHDVGKANGSNSDIDIHVFVDHIEYLLILLDHLGWQYEKTQVTIQQSGRLHEYHHVHLWFDYPIELSVYPTLEIRHTTRSSIDGKAIQRLSLSKVEALLECH